MSVFGQDHATVAAAQYQAQDLGYFQIAMTGAAISVATAIGGIPTDARWALITTEGTAADTIRWRADGSAPASGSGNPIPVAVAPAYTWPPLIYAADFTNLQVFGATTSKVNIQFYK